MVRHLILLERLGFIIDRHEWIFIYFLGLIRYLSCSASFVLYVVFVAGILISFAVFFHKHVILGPRLSLFSR